MPTLAELVDGAYRALADEAQEVFSTLQVEDFIRGGIADLNRVAPTDSVYVLPLTTDVDTGLVTTFSYDTPIELPYRIEVRRLSDDASYDLTEPVDGWIGNGGYSFKRTATGSTIEFPRWWLTNFPADDYVIRLHGYAPRPMPYTTDPDPDLSPQVGLSTEEQDSVITYALAQGYDLLAHDRSLFAQWQGQTNNTDVSPTQMMQMAGNARNDWDRQRGLIRVVRKYA